jgi:hypothetical protein
VIETVVNIIQLIITGACSGIALFNAVRTEHRAWTLVGLFSGIFFMGDLYWLLFLLFYGETPPYSFIPYMSWYASYLFMLLLLVTIKGGIRRRPVRRILIPVMLFTVSMCLYYMTFGDYIGNIICMLLMSMLIYHSADGLINHTEQVTEGNNRSIFEATLFFCFAEYGSWTVSCFSEGRAVRDLYYLFDLLLSLSFILIVLAARKAVDR